MTSSARDRIALAADIPLFDAVSLYSKIAGDVGWAKVGLSLFVQHGPTAVEEFRALGAKVFLDLKLHDIPNTVELAAARAGELGVGLLTVHAGGGTAMLKAAVAGAREGAARKGHAPPKVLAVTVLTSLSDEALREAGHVKGASELVQVLAAMAVRAGVDGLVCSPREAKALRDANGPNVFLCTPGIRPAGAEAGDQARAETPAFAARAGSSLLVVGRPIYGADDPAAAASAIAQEVAQTQS